MADLLRSGSGAPAPAGWSWATTSGVIVTRWGGGAPSRVPPRACEGWGGRGPSSDQVLGLGERLPQDLLHLVELRLAADERRGDLDDHVAAVVGAAVQTVVEQRTRQ